MRTYVLRRILLLIPTFLILTIIVFMFIRLMPGSVIQLIVNELPRGSSSGGTQVDAQAIRHALGLDQPIMTQYWQWLIHLVRGDTGKSLWTNQSVTKDILGRLPVTFELGLLAFIFAQVIAFPVGILSAMRPDAPADYVARSIAIIAVAVPNFWLATMVFVFPARWWGWSPPVAYVPIGQDFWSNLEEFAIPAAILGFGMAGLTMRMLRTTMLDVLRQDYVRTAWAKGLRERVILVRHVLKNAAIPVATIVAGQLPVLIGGEVIMENIFALPGMGRLLVESINRRDYPYISAINAGLSVFGLIIILLTDLSYAWLDPRIRYH